MSLVINHNMMAMNSARNLSDHYGQLSVSTRRLSSGLRIGTAADDAAGLAIRELMRADIATLNQGIRNANDAVSMLQVADGAMQIIDEKLIRMKELAEQASTGTYNSDQRLIIDSEFQAMKSEIDRIAVSTNFNGIKLLDTRTHVINGNSVIYIDSPGATELSSNVMLNLPFNGTVDDISGNNHTVSGTNYSYTVGPEGGQAVTFDGVTNDMQVDFGMSGDSFTIQFWVNANSLSKPISQLITSNAPPGKRRYEIQLTNNGNVEVWFSNSEYTNHIYSANGTIQTGDWHLITNTYDNGDYVLYVDGVPVIQQSNGYGDTFFTMPMWIGYDPHLGEQFDGSIDSLRIYDKALTPDAIEEYYNSSGDIANIPQEAVDVETQLIQDIPIHFGTGNDSTQDYYSFIVNSATASSLGLSSLTISRQESAQTAILQIGNAIVQKDKIRAYIGAMQNRLENTISNLQIQAENLQAAESRISDTDVSQEMTEFVREQILTQAATAMLAQANSLPKMALQIISGG